MSADLVLIRRIAAEGLEENLLDSLARQLQVDFAVNLAIARQMWNRFPDLVQSKNFPEPFRAAYIKTCGNAPEDEESAIIDPRSDDAKELLRRSLNGQTDNP